MIFAPAAMFAMFYFLSQYIQNVMGYSPLKAGVAFLPFCVGIVVARRHLLQPGQPDRPALPRRRRHADGRRSRCSASPGCPYDDHAADPGPSTAQLRRPTCCPFIVLMSFGMGMTFVPLTLTAVHHLRDEDSGIGSGVLNTMQQVGGALGLAMLAHGRAALHHRPRRRRCGRGRRRPQRPATATRARSRSCSS